MYKRIILLLSIIYMLIVFAGCGGNATVSAEAGSSGSRDGRTDAKQKPMVNGILIDNTAAVIIDTVADIYAEPDVKSERLTQALFNQPVSVLEEKGGWSKVVSVDGSRGWIRTKFLDRDTGSVYGRSFTHRIIVTSKDKSIYSDPTGGITIKDVTMGTELYTFNDSGTSYEVYLPGNTTGWIRESGIIHVDLNADITLTSKKDFVASTLKFKGASFLMNGMSTMGIDSEGMAYICARINGLALPRSLKELEQFGMKISLDEIAAGDLVFLSPTGDENGVGSIGICTGNGQYIHASRTAGYVRLDGLNESGSDGKPVFARRIFR